MIRNESPNRLREGTGKRPPLGWDRSGGSNAATNARRSSGTKGFAIRLGSVRSRENILSGRRRLSARYGRSRTTILPRRSYALSSIRAGQPDQCLGPGVQCSLPIGPRFLVGIALAGLISGIGTGEPYDLVLDAIVTNHSKFMPALAILAAVSALALPGETVRQRVVTSLTSWIKAVAMTTA